MSYKWGHPVATLPVTNGTIHHTRRITEILRINPPAPIRLQCSRETNTKPGKVVTSTGQLEG
eukprot:4346942-Pleurochrysis_carterae.AAC.1